MSVALFSGRNTVLILTLSIFFLLYHGQADPIGTPKTAENTSATGSGPVTTQASSDTEAGVVEDDQGANSTLNISRTLETSLGTSNPTNGSTTATSPTTTTTTPTTTAAQDQSTKHNGSSASGSPTDSHSSTASPTGTQSSTAGQTTPTKMQTTQPSTSVPKVTSAAPRSGFDGGSFVGGMVLSAAIAIFMVVGWKCYKIKTGRKYQTL